MQGWWLCEGVELVDVCEGVELVDGVYEGVELVDLAGDSLPQKMSPFQHLPDRQRLTTRLGLTSDGNGCPPHLAILT